MQAWYDHDRSLVVVPICILMLVLPFLLLAVGGRALLWYSHYQPIVLPGVQIVLDQGEAYSWTNCAGDKYFVHGEIVGGYLSRQQEALTRAREQAAWDRKAERIFYGGVAAAICVALAALRVGQRKKQVKVAGCRVRENAPVPGPVPGLTAVN